jgi:cytidyltransferase-like protein
MKISTLLEERKLLAVVYGGRFQPFHKGHYAVYRELCKTFGEGSVWIATSNKTNFDPGEGDVSPFTFDEKLEMMVQLFGVSPEKVIKCKNPAFSPKEVLELYKAPTVCVMVCGDKDVERYSKSKMYKPYPTKQDQPVPFSQAMGHLQTTTSEPPQFYYVISDARNGSQSGTSIRSAFQAAGDDEGKQVAAFKKFYGKVNDDMLDLMVSKIRMIKPPPPPKKDKKDEPPVKSKAKELPEPKLDKELSLTEASIK